MHLILHRKKKKRKYESTSHRETEGERESLKKPFLKPPGSPAACCLGCVPVPTHTEKAKTRDLRHQHTPHTTPHHITPHLKAAFAFSPALFASPAVALAVTKAACCRADACAAPLATLVTSLACTCTLEAWALVAAVCLRVLSTC